MLGTFVAGRYSATYNANSLGIMERGYELDFQLKQELVDESDLYGMQIIDMFIQGCDSYVSMMAKEWLTGSKAILWALGGGVLGKIFSAAVPCGASAYDLSQSLVFTATANTPAATSPATLTASKAFPAPNFNPKTLLNSRLRQLPLRMLMFPYASSSDTIAFSTT